ncbi:MAG: hypothetical protein OXC09_12270 [Truepera sp.]|nr:hypothetical protein [Truepera sp.]
MPFPIELLLDELLNGIDIDDTALPFAAVTCPLDGTDCTALTSGNLATGIHASIAMPVLIRPVEIGGTPHLDGGVKAAVQATAARALGAEVIIGVDASPNLTSSPGDVIGAFRLLLRDLRLPFNEDQLREVDILRPRSRSYPVQLRTDPEGSPGACGQPRGARRAPSGAGRSSR